MAEMICKLNLTQAELADMLKKSIAYVSQHLGVLTGYSDVADALKENKISFTVARELNQFKTPELASMHLRYAVRGGATSDMIRQWRWETEAEDFGVPQEDDHKLSVEEMQRRVSGFTCDSCREARSLTSLHILKICTECYETIRKNE
jgi:hypothetical protein